MSNDDYPISSRSYWERAAIYLMGIMLAFTIWAFQEQTKRVEKLENTVVMLQTSKVDKGDLAQVETRINTNIAAMKSDILARLDLYFKK